MTRSGDMDWCSKIKNALQSPVVIFGCVVIVLFGAIMMTSDSFQVCYNQYQQASKQNKPESSPAILGPIYRCTGQFLKVAHYEILGAFTVLLAFFTGTLWWATRELHQMARVQEDTSRKHERAYIYGGGPYGAQIKEPKDENINDPRDYGKLKWMTVQNYGKTPGHIKKVEWGLYPADRFPKLADAPHAIVSKIIDDALLDSGLIKPHKKIETVKYPSFVVPPTPGREWLPYRQVEFIHDERVLEHIFFARITYDDIFGKEHYSTFKLFLNKEYRSDPYEDGYADEDADRA